MRAVRRYPSLLLATALLVSLTSLTGCGSETDAAPNTPAGESSETSEEPTDTQAAADPNAVCAAITDDQVAAVLGGPVTRKEIPGGGCGFDQEDPRAASVSIVASEYDEGNGGFDAAKSGVSGVLEGTDDREITGVGDEAFVATGTMMGGSNTQASGVVRAGDLLVQASLVQGTGLTTDQVVEMVTKILTIAAAAA